MTVLRDGRLIRTSAAADETPERLVLAMLGRTMGLNFPDKTPPPADTPVVLSVRNLSRPPHVNDVSFEVRAGEIVGLAGLIGSGRTEVARAVFAADRPASGTIEVAGVPLRARTPRQAIGHGVVMLPEDRKGQGLLMLALARRERHLAAPGGRVHGRLDGAARGEAPRRGSAHRSRRAGEIAARARRHTLGREPAEDPVREMALSPPARFHRGRADPGVDVGAKRAIYELLHSLAAEGIAVLLISSEHEEVLGLAHRVLVMRGGEIVARFEGETMTESAVLSAAFGTQQAEEGTDP